MPNPSRTGDIGAGTCPAHDSPVSYNTVLVAGQSTVNIQGAPDVRVGDTGIASCGHPTVCLTGAATVFSVAAQTHRVGDVGSNPGSYVSLDGAPTVFVE